MILPIYLDATLQKQLEPLARSQGKGIGDVVNDILKNQVQLLTTLNPSKRPNKPMQPTAPDFAFIVVGFGTLGSALV